MLDVDYDPEASTELIDSTLLSMMAEDAEMAKYLQKMQKCWATA